MIFRSLPKRDLSPDPPRANAERPGGLSARKSGSRVRGSGSEVRWPTSPENCSRFTVHYSLLTAHDSRSNESGFTLIEVIASLIIISVLAAMIFPATGGGLWRTARGVGECRELFELQGQMEEIVSAYKTALSSGNGDVNLEDFRDNVIGFSYVDTGSTGFLVESGSDLTLTASPTSLLLITLTAGDQRIANVFAGN